MSEFHQNDERWQNNSEIRLTIFKINWIIIIDLNANLLCRCWKAIAMQGAAQFQWWNEQLLSEDIQPSQRQNLRHIQRQWQTQRQKQFQQWWNEQHWNEVVSPSPWEMSLPFRNPVCCAFLVGPLSLSLFVGGLQFVNVCPSRVIDIRRNSELESKESKTLLVEKSICQKRSWIWMSITRVTRVSLCQMSFPIWKVVKCDMSRL